MNEYNKILRGFHCSAVKHGVGWRVSTQCPSTGVVYTEYASDMDEAAERVVAFLEQEREGERSGETFFFQTRLIPSGMWHGTQAVSFKIARRLAAIEHRRRGEARIIDKNGKEIDRSHYTRILKDEAEEAFVSSCTGGIRHNPWTKLYTVEQFWGGKWGLHMDFVDFLAAQRLAAAFHRKGVKMRILDKETGLFLDEKLHSGKLSPSQEDIISMSARTIGGCCSCYTDD